MDIAAWLQSLDLTQYAEAFRANDVDADVLPELTAEDLKALGVASVGHRRRLLAAIAALRDGDGQIKEATEPDKLTPSEPADAERRQLTVMFVDLIGSTALSARLDPEDMREVLNAYQRAVAGEIARFEGHVAKYLGDGVLAYFGYPRAHEDEAERSVRSALSIVTAVHTLCPKIGVTLQTRIGIATGPVVVGELIGEGAAREQAVVGETPNVAARLQALAEPGAVVIGARTRRLIGGLFELADLGIHHLKGLPAPVRAWRVLGESLTQSRFEALRAPRLTPLVGRTHELGLLLDRWERAKEGDGQVVLLSGEPGIGKSRLVQALRERLGDEPHTPLSHYCSPHHQTSPLYPVIGLLERAAGFTRDDTPAQRLDKLEAMLALSSDHVAVTAPLLAVLLSIPSGDRYPPLNMSPLRQKEQMLEVLVDQLAGLATRQPVLAVYEDVHWSDPTMLELLDLVVERVQTLKALVIITFRPEFVPPWTRHAHVTALTLSRLSRKQGAAMVGRLTGDRALPPPVLEQIVAKTDGVPLFVEELTRTVLESGLLDSRGDHYVLTGPLPLPAIPDTLHDSLLARLDRLTLAKQIAQVGAAIGREFTHELLAAVVPLTEGQLLEALADLIASGLVTRRGVPPEAIYSFKHALVRDVAYATLLRGKRQQLHARIANALESRFPEAAETEPEIIAHHFAEAGLAEKAIGYLLRAGRAALARSATAEAIVQLTRGLELLNNLPDDAARLRQELELQVALGVALMAAKGWAAPETGKANARARALCEQIGESECLLPVLYGQWVFHVVRAELAAGQEAGNELLRRAEEHSDVAGQVVGHRIVGTALLIRGELIAARAHLERALALYEPVRHRSLAFLYAQDPQVAGLSVLSWTLFALGYPEQAWTRSGEVLSAARALSHLNTLGYALMYGSALAQFSRHAKEAAERAEALATLAAEQGFPHFLGAAMIIRGSVLSAAGETETGIAQIRQGLTAWQDTGAGFLVPYFRGLMAAAHARAGDSTEALMLLADALAHVDRTGERWFEAELHRLKGECLYALAGDRSEQAEDSLRRALAVGRSQDARMWELRAAATLARLWRAQGKQSQARDLLAPICGRFTEGFATPDLIDARALLETLQ